VEIVGLGCILISPENLFMEWKFYWPDAPEVIGSLLISMSCSLPYIDGVDHAV